MAKTPINTDYVVKESHTICSIGVAMAVVSLFAVVITLILI